MTNARVDAEVSAIIVVIDRFHVWGIIVPIHNRARRYDFFSFGRSGSFGLSAAINSVNN